MRLDYAAFVIGQEAPEQMPNEIAYKLSELLGYDHYMVHLALINLNPELVAINEEYYLPLDLLPDVAAQIGDMLLAEFMLNP